MMLPSLQGLQVLVTRPLDQSQSLSSAINNAGGIALPFPLLDITPVEDARMLHQQLAQLQHCNLAIFISPNAVSYGLAAIAAARATLPKQVATIGAGSARALREAGIASVIAPTERSDSEGLLALPELADMRGKHVIILRGDGGRELLADTLSSRGAIVEYASCYQRSKTRKTLDELLALRPEVLTVTSSEALAHLLEMMSENVALLALPLFVPHARIAESARSLGWREVILTASGDDGLLASLIAWRNTKGAT
jgi:uroporphyrinogen-III synthase